MQPMVQERKRLQQILIVAAAAVLKLSGFHRRCLKVAGFLHARIRCVEIVFARNSNQREQGISSRISEGRP